MRCKWDTGIAALNLKLNKQIGWLVVLKKMKVSWDDDIPNIWKNKPNVPNHQPEIGYVTFFAYGNDWQTWCVAPRAIGDPETRISICTFYSSSVFNHTNKNTSMDPDMPLNIVNSSKPILLLVIYIIYIYIYSDFTFLSLKNPCKKYVHMGKYQ